MSTDAKLPGASDVAVDLARIVAGYVTSTEFMEYGEYMHRLTAAIEADRAALRSAVVKECAREVIIGTGWYETTADVLEDIRARIRALATRTGGNEE